jgi:hypothetical protein
MAMYLQTAKVIAKQMDIVWAICGEIGRYVNFRLDNTL